jgi:hypothetical protein
MELSHVRADRTSMAATVEGCLGAQRQGHHNPDERRDSRRRVTALKHGAETVRRRQPP